jgi:L-asparaginase II
MWGRICLLHFLSQETIAAQRDKKPLPIHNNCSGKTRRDACRLPTSKTGGRDDYLSPDHPLQRGKI